ncbi:hypothetical protein HYQ45_003148 [Verticillium longisporum]|uniref:Altered inheritance of mitochondria protein 11 n=1 Tax=Verticillium longisporum TaxID=100787 RepID=A0A8I2ZW12_VERLO|nr:hypothetical protein HYQ45_003148 [Verticillium longisporum]
MNRVKLGELGWTRLSERSHLLPSCKLCAPQLGIRCSLQAPQGLKQLGLFFAGASFLVCSTLITKRAVTRKKLAALPKFYQPSHAAAGKQENPEGSLIALEALNLATLNVFSFAVMATGGVAWAFDVSSVDDLREKARRTIRGEAGKTDEAAEREFEEWATRVLTKLGQTPAAEENSSQGKPSASEKKD